MFLSEDMPCCTNEYPPLFQRCLKVVGQVAGGHVFDMTAGCRVAEREREREREGGGGGGGREGQVE